MVNRIKLFIYTHVVVPIFGDYIQDDINDYIWENPDVCREVIE